MSPDHGKTEEANLSSAFANRVLHVYEVIAKNGPIKLSELSELTEIPKVSAWRAVRSLKERGWVRSRIIDEALEASSHLDRVLTSAHISMHEVDEAVEIVKHFEKITDLEVQVGMLSAAGTYSLIDGSRRRYNYLPEVSLAYDSAPTAALLMCSRLDILRHLEVFSRSSSKDERDYIMSGEKIREVERLASKLLVWRPDEAGFSLPVVFSTGSSGSVEFVARKFRIDVLIELEIFSKTALDWAKSRLFNANLEKSRACILFEGSLHKSADG